MKTAPKHASAGAVHRKGTRCLDILTLRQIFSPRKRLGSHCDGTADGSNVRSSTAGMLKPLGSWMPVYYWKNR